MKIIFRILAVVAFGAVFNSYVRAAEWAIEPSIESRASLTDNINLVPGVHDNVFGWAVSPKVMFARRTEASDVAGTASVGINRYPGNAGLDADDASFQLSSKLTTERSLYGLTGAFIRDSTLESELAATGIVQARRQRNLLSLAPSWNYMLTERSSTFAQYQFDKAGYQSGAGLEDYSNQQATAGYQYVLAERTVASLSGSYSRYRTDSGSIRTHSYGLNAALTYSATERLSLTAGIGGRSSDTTITQTALLCPFGPAVLCEIFGVPLEPFTSTAKTKDSGLAYNASAEYRWERSTASLIASRDLNPTGSGLMVKTDRLAFLYRREFDERLSGSANGAYLSSRYLGGLGSNTDYYRLDLGLSLKLDERWTAGLGYSYAYQIIQDVSSRASANSLILTIGYNWPKISISR